MLFVAHIVVANHCRHASPSASSDKVPPGRCEDSTPVVSLFRRRTASDELMGHARRTARRMDDRSSRSEPKLARMSRHSRAIRVLFASRGPPCSRAGESVVRMAGGFGFGRSIAFIISAT